MSSGHERVEMPAEQAREIRDRFVSEGKLKVIPAKRIHKLVVFEHLAALFELERRYSEKEFNQIIATVHEDFATLRRGLYDERFVDRADGFYWRTPHEQKLSIVSAKAD